MKYKGKRAVLRMALEKCQQMSCISIGSLTREGALTLDRKGTGVRFKVSCLNFDLQEKNSLHCTGVHVSNFFLHRPKGAIRVRVWCEVLQSVRFSGTRHPAGPLRRQGEIAISAGS